MALHLPPPPGYACFSAVTAWRARPSARRAWRPCLRQTLAASQAFRSPGSCRPCRCRTSTGWPCPCGLSTPYASAVFLSGSLRSGKSALCAAAKALLPCSPSIGSTLAMKYFTLYFLIMSPCSASDLHSIVQPWVNAFGNHASDDGLLALEVRELVGLAVARLKAEIWGLVTDLQLRSGSLSPACRCHHQHCCHHHCTAHSTPPCPRMISRDVHWTRVDAEGSQGRS